MMSSTQARAGHWATVGLHAENREGIDWAAIGLRVENREGVGWAGSHFRPKFD
jgi:hypothetical protein